MWSNIEGEGPRVKDSIIELFLNASLTDNSTIWAHFVANQIIVDFWLTNDHWGKSLLSLETQFICLFQNSDGAIGRAQKELLVFIFITDNSCNIKSLCRHSTTKQQTSLLIWKTILETDPIKNIYSKCKTLSVCIIWYKRNT